MDNKQKIEVARSFGQNLFLEAFKPINFFMSAKTECNFEDVESIAKELYHVCRQTVEKEIEEYKSVKERENVIDISNAYGNAIERGDTYTRSNGQGTFPKSKKMKQSEVQLAFDKSEEHADSQRERKSYADN